MEFSLNTRTQLVLLNAKLRKKRKVDFIVDTLVKLLNGSDLDDLVSTVKDIASLIENQINNINKSLEDKIDKKQVFNLIVKKLFSNVDEDGLNTMNDMLEFLLKNNHIKRIPYSSVMYFKLKSAINKFFFH